VISITVSSPEGSYIEYIRMPFPIYRYVINVGVSVGIYAFNQIFCGKAYYSNTTIITILM